MSQREEWDRMFDAIDDDGRRYVLAVLRGEYERACPLPRARLRLVSSNNIVAGFAKGQVNALPVGSAG